MYELFLWNSEASFLAVNRITWWWRCQFHTKCVFTRIAYNQRHIHTDTSTDTNHNHIASTDLFNDLYEQLNRLLYSGVSFTFTRCYWFWLYFSNMHLTHAYQIRSTACWEYCIYIERSGIAISQLSIEMNDKVVDLDG